MNRIRSVLFALLVLALIGIPSATAADASVQKPSAIRILVTDLQRSQRPIIRVTGPRSFARSLTRSQTLDSLRAGTYVVEARPVKSQRGTTWPTAARTSLHLSGGIKTVIVDYATFVPTTTKDVPSGATEAIFHQSGQEFIALSTKSPAAIYKDSDILASGPTTDAPDGYLVKVNNIVSSGSGQEMLEVGPTSLAQAFPDGVIDVADPSRSVNVEFAPTGLLPCMGGASIGVTGSLRFEPNFSFVARWRLGARLAIDVTARLDATLQLSAEGEAFASCETRDPGIPLPVPLHLPPIPATIGGLPVVVVPQLQVYLSGSAKIEGKVTADLTQDVDFKATFHRPKSGERPEPKITLPPTRVDFTTTGRAGGDIFVTPTVHLLLYGLGGPTVSLGAGIGFQGTGLQEWSLSACLRAGVGFAMPAFGVFKAKPDLISKCKEIAASAPTD